MDGENPFELPIERTLNLSFLSLSEKEKAWEGSSNFSFFFVGIRSMPIIVAQWGGVAKSPIFITSE